jgi:hypothetical protein
MERHRSEQKHEQNGNEAQSFLSRMEFIADHSREKERDLALDQQHETILIDYQTFLVTLLSDNELSLGKSSSAGAVRRFMTLTRSSRLYSKRKSFFIQFLYEVQLITLPRNSKWTDQSILDLHLEDLGASTNRDGMGVSMSILHLDAHAHPHPQDGLKMKFTRKWYKIAFLCFPDSYNF